VTSRAPVLPRRASATATLLAALAVLAAAPRPVRADPPACPEDIAGELPSDTEVERRLAWISTRIDDTEDDIRRWYGAFVVMHTVMTGVQLTLAIATPQDENRPDFIVNTTSSALGLLTLLISTPSILGAGEALRALPRDSREARLASLRVAERRLQRSAEGSRMVRSELSAVASALYGEAASLTLLFLGRPSGAILHAAGSVVLGQGRLLLHPTGAIDSWRAYQARHPEAGCLSDAVPAPLPAVSDVTAAPAAVGVGGVGMTLSLSF
jgi:ethanolamine utilization microcompartment shell protein EutS